MSALSDIQLLIKSFGTDLNVDLQQRGVEFSQLFGTYNSLRPALLEKMPPMQLQRDSSQNGGSFDETAESGSPADLLENGSREKDLGIVDQSVSFWLLNDLFCLSVCLPS